MIKVKRILMSSLIASFLLIVFVFKNKFGIFLSKKKIQVNQSNLSKEMISIFKHLAVYVPHSSFCILFNSFMEDEILQLVGDLNNFKELELNPILIVVVKDDLNKVRYQHQYCKKIGIKRFVYIDNGSQDGTKEYLESLSDVILFETFSTYHAGKKNAWIYRIIEMIGFDRWYMILDSDEIPTYPYCEVVHISYLMEFLEMHRIQMVDSFFLDMYTNKQIHLNDYNQDNNEDFDQYRYYDENLYIVPTFRGLGVKGGMRARVFHDSLRNRGPQLRKVCLIKPSKKTIYSTHFGLPYYKNYKFEPLIALRHLKFTMDDLGFRYNKIIEEGLYANNSLEYKKSISRIVSIDSLFSPKYSEEYSKSLDLFSIKIFKSNLAYHWSEYCLKLDKRLTDHIFKRF